MYFQAVVLSQILNPLHRISFPTIPRRSTCMPACEEIHKLKLCSLLHNSVPGLSFIASVCPPLQTMASKTYTFPSCTLCHPDIYYRAYKDMSGEYCICIVHGVHALYIHAVHIGVECCSASISHDLYSAGSVCLELQVTQSQACG